MNSIFKKFLRACGVSVCACGVSGVCTFVFVVCVWYEGIILCMHIAHTEWNCVHTGNYC